MLIFGLKQGQDLENLAARSHQEFPKVPPGPAQWWRYRGDIFDLWQQGTMLQNLLLNTSIHYILLLSLNWFIPRTSLMFQMSRLHLVYRFIQTGVYSKPTDSYLYPSPPPPTPILSMFFKAIPFEVTSRLRTNFSNDVFRLTKRM